MVEDMIQSIKEVDEQIIDNVRILKMFAGDEKHTDEWKMLARLTERLIESRSRLSYTLTKFGVYGV